MHRRTLHTLAVLAASALPLRAAEPKPSPSPAPATTAASVKAFEFRSIGPAIMGGRIDDFAVVESAPVHLLRGHRRRAASGRR